MFNPKYDGEKCAELLHYCEGHFKNERVAWLHLLAAAFSLQRNNTVNGLMLDDIERSG